MAPQTSIPRLAIGLPSSAVRSAAERREQLKAVYEEARDCVRCPLHQTRTTVVFGSGNANADLMFIGEAPGANEDRMGLPFVGQAGKGRGAARGGAAPPSATAGEVPSSATKQ